MNLILAYLNRGIEGYVSKELEKIITYRHTIKIKTISNGTIFLNNDKIIKCVSNYYKTKEGVISKKKNTSNACFYVQKDLGIQNVRVYNCSDCHIECIGMNRDKKLLRI